MKKLPEGASLYGRTPEFTENSIPKNLLSAHRTKARTWGRIVVLDGRLRYRILESNELEVELSANQPGIIEPTVLHAVEPIGNVKFYVEFYR